MALYSFIGAAVTSATIVIFGKAIWDPVDVLTRFNNPVVLVGAMLALCLATLATNIAANVVSPANDFANLAPRFISFRTGGLITGLLGILIMPWYLVANAERYIGWLIGYSALLGPIGGILIADYFVYRRRRLNLIALYDENGEYRFSGGISWIALFALFIAIVPNLPGFLATIKVLPVDSINPIFMTLYSYAWFVGFAIAFVVYLGARMISPSPANVRSPAPTLEVKS